MKKVFTLSERDKPYEEDIKIIIDTIQPFIVDFYKAYNIIVNGIKYDSTLELHQKTEISFVLNIPNIITTFYPDFKINVSDLGSAYLKPSERIFRGVFFIRGVSNKLADELFDIFNISRLFFVESKQKSPIYKIEEILKEAEEKWLNKWKQYGIVNTIFMF